MPAVIRGLRMCKHIKQRWCPDSYAPHCDQGVGDNCRAPVSMAGAKQKGRKCHSSAFPENSLFTSTILLRQIYRKLVVQF